MRSIAVIIAARDAARWIEECVHSVASQRLPPGWQMRVCIGVDHCEPTFRRAMTLCVPGLQVVMFSRQVGPYIVFNSLAHFAHDDLLSRFDADDVMRPGYLMAQIEPLAAETGPALSQTWSVYVDESMRPMRAPLHDGSRTGVDGRRDQPSDGQFAMTQSVWGLLGGFRPWWCHADTEFLTRARLLGLRRHVCPEHLYLRRIHSGSLTSAPRSSYRSELRQHYAAQVAATRTHFASRRAVERVTPTVAPYFTLRPSPVR